jgi:hypothetical protein
MPAPAQAELLGVLRYEDAAHAYIDLLAGSASFTDGERTQRAASLLTHGDARARGRAILALLGHGNSDWATDALSQEAPFALPWIVTRNLRSSSPLQRVCRVMPAPAGPGDERSAA